MRLVAINAFPEEKLAGIQNRAFSDGVGLWILDCKAVVLKLRMYERIAVEQIKETGECQRCQKSG